MSARETEVDAFRRLLGNAVAIVTSFASALVLTFIIDQHARVEITLIVVFAVLIWIVVDRKLRSLLAIYPVTRENKQWNAWLTRLLDFVLLLGIFLVAQLVIVTLRSAFDDGDLSGLEVIVFVAAGLGTAFAFMSSIQRLTETLSVPSTKPT